MKNRKIRIAVQNKGRLTSPSLEFLKSFGLRFRENGSNLVMKCENADLEVLFVRNSDIPTYVEQNVTDFGIVGGNVLVEKSFLVYELAKLGFGICKLVIAVPRRSGISEVADLCGERIATSYPVTLRKFMKKKGVKSAIIEIKGSVEIAPELNLADAVCDITQTGTTLKENGLKVIETILKSEAVLIGGNKGVDFEKLLTKKS